MEIIDAAEVLTAAPPDRLIPALCRAFRSDVTAPSRHSHDLTASDGTCTSLIMPAWTDGYYGVKIVNIAPGNGRSGMPAVHAVYILFDARTGQPLAQIEGSILTAIRTAAVSALAASYLARSDAHRLLIVGAGRVAAHLPRAFAEVRSLSSVEVWNIRPHGAERLASELRDAGLAAHATTDLGAALARADIVSCATLSEHALIEGSRLPEGCHLDLVGSFTPSMRETDTACFASKRVFVDTEDAVSKAGDFIHAIREGVFKREDLEGTVKDLCTGRVNARINETEITVFKSVGLASADLCAAILAYENGLHNRQLSKSAPFSPTEIFG